MMTFDEVKNPVHYNGDGEVQCKRAMKSMLSAVPLWMSGDTVYWWGCAFKYLWRWPNKNKVKDINKAIESLENMRRSAIEDLAERSGIDVETFPEEEMYD